ncbi:acyloxyacyl hydrolase [Cupriavidus taiwanensis]|uniref:Lipid A deacylase n=1 Tax=Cupriavidus taiwanensis TaxID=164546 RepID=A0A375FMR2_9BURK|nr:acyloxyacyl hydrolase [Cupriavidus taiwanensis]SOY58113.1 putative lipoprotein [Cupriavidus taiwanensis]SOY85873.1 putative lipoprotein [Cupriavidus taiwanensis]SOZ02139.1 putative lipoprotein [Cupriavidus taiwanensis]SOZ05128.1 putative lipoprotein [Cupriavidus taiwanensis]SPC05761.1 Lipid A deacylase [Cupriavidus taiwanensis]
MSVKIKNAARWLPAAAAVSFATCLLALPGAAGAAGFSMQAGYGRDNRHGVEKYEVSARWDEIVQWQLSNRLALALDGEVNVANWRALSSRPSSQLTEFGVSPIFRLSYAGEHVTPFVEASVGLRVLSHTEIAGGHRMGSAFQFSDMIGVGVAFGKAQRLTVGYRFQHLSNAGIQDPNPGTNFSMGYVRYRF